MGGVASGKSLVARGLERRGAVRIDADVEAHAVLGDPHVRLLLARRFGPSVTTPEGTIDRAALGRAVFDDPDALRFLERTVHPRIRDRLRARLEGLAPGSVAVLEAALLVEKGLDAWCDLVVYVDAPAAERAARATRHRGWPADEVERRERNQSLARKRERATDVIDNAGSREDLEREMDELWRRRVRPDA